MKYVTASEMKAIDENAIAKHGIPAIRLMENAGRAVAKEASKSVSKGKVAVFCGYGNNGGDGFVAARYLIEKGYDVKVFLAGKPKPFTPETKSNFEKLVKLKCSARAIFGEEDIDKVFPEIAKTSLIIDALFGIGIKGKLESFYVKLIKRINAVNSPVISIDMPSGLDSDTGNPLPVAIKACKTVTFGLPKIGFKSNEAKNYTGEVIIADIGLPKRKMRPLHENKD